MVFYFNVWPAHTDLSWNTVFGGRASGGDQREMTHVDLNAVPLSHRLADADFATLQTDRNLNFILDDKKEYSGEEPNNHAYSHWESTHLLAEAMKVAESSGPEADPTHSRP